MFLPKALPSFFKNTVKIRNLAAIRIRQILEDFFGDYIHFTVNSIATNSASDIKHLSLYILQI